MERYLFPLNAEELTQLGGRPYLQLTRREVVCLRQVLTKTIDEHEILDDVERVRRPHKPVVIGKIERSA